MCKELRLVREGKRKKTTSIIHTEYGKFVHASKYVYVMSTDYVNAVDFFHNCELLVLVAVLDEMCSTSNVYNHFYFHVRVVNVKDD